MIFDVLVIGGGPGAMAAMIYLARQKRSFVVLTKEFGSQAAWGSEGENASGFYVLDGRDVAKRLKAELEAYRAAFTLKEGESVTRLEKTPHGFQAILEGGDTYEGKTVLVATGSRHRVLNVPGESALINHGVTYGAAYDAPLYEDKVVFVIGGGNAAMDAALFLEKYAQRVTIVTVNTDIKGDEAMRKQVFASKKIRVESSTKVAEILGEKHVTGIKLTGGDGHERIELCDEVCIEIGSVPSSQMVDLVAKDTRGQVIVDKTNATNVAGIWAAGDVTDVAQKHIAVAVGEGVKASLSIIRHFQTT